MYCNIKSSNTNIYKMTSRSNCGKKNSYDEGIALLDIIKLMA